MTNPSRGVLLPTLKFAGNTAPSNAVVSNLHIRKRSLIRNNRVGRVFELITLLFFQFTLCVNVITEGASRISHMFITLILPFPQPERDTSRRASHCPSGMPKLSVSPWVAIWLPSPLSKRTTSSGSNLLLKPK